MQLLAAVEADSSIPLVETLIGSVGRLRRGMTAVVITASLDPSWVRPLASLRARGVACVVITLDANAYAHVGSGGRSDPAVAEAAAKRARALHHALAEYEIKTFAITPGRALGEVLAG